MTYQVSDANQRLGKGMSQEQFSQIIEAILAGKYSWACVLLLRFAGYNPLHYMPYRTYNRLLKENCQIGRSNLDKKDSINTVKQEATIKSKPATLNKIADLVYVETVSEPHNKISGGISQSFWDNFYENNFI